MGADWGDAEEITHRCPPEGSGVMPCCGRTPFEVPRWHRLTLDPDLVTCHPVYGDCGMDVVDLPAHHDVEFPRMAFPGDVTVQECG